MQINHVQVCAGIEAGSEHGSLQAPTQNECCNLLIHFFLKREKIPIPLLLVFFFHVTRPYNLDTTSVIINEI